MPKLVTQWYKATPQFGAKMFFFVCAIVVVAVNDKKIHKPKCDTMRDDKHKMIMVMKMTMRSTKKKHHHPKSQHQHQQEWSIRVLEKKMRRKKSSQSDDRNKEIMAATSKISEE